MIEQNKYMKLENTLSGVALIIASLSINDMVNVVVAITVGVTALLVNLHRRGTDKVVREREELQKELIKEQLKDLRNEK